MNLLLVAYFLLVLAMLGRPARGKVGRQAAGMAGIAAALWGWTPFLAGGFAGNLLIAALAMLLGTALGSMLGRARDLPAAWLRSPAAAMTSVCRNVPSFVLMFYVALVLPVELPWRGSFVTVPLLSRRRWR